VDIELGIKKAQEELVDLQKAIAELSMLNEKYKAENCHVQKSIQSEIVKNNNHSKNLKGAEYTFKVRAGQVEEASREVKALREENQSLGEINYKLTEDLEACKAHLQNLGLVNSKVNPSLLS
jgi:chromosome segregation ATPase